MSSQSQNLSSCSGRQLKYKLLLLTAILLGQTMPLPAMATESLNQSAEKRAAIEQLFKVSRFDQQVEHAFANVNSAFDAPAAALAQARFAKQTQLSGSERAQKAFAATKFIVDRFKQLLHQEMDFKHEAEMIWTEIIDQNMNLDDVKSIIAFYETPTGQKSLDADPKIQADLEGQLNAEIVPKAHAILSNIMQERDEQMQKGLQKANQKLKGPI